MRGVSTAEPRHGQRCGTRNEQEHRRGTRNDIRSAIPPRTRSHSTLKDSLPQYDRLVQLSVLGGIQERHSLMRCSPSEESLGKKASSRRTAAAMTST